MLLKSAVVLLASVSVVAAGSLPVAGSIDRSPLRDSATAMPGVLPPVQMATADLEPGVPRPAVKGDRVTPADLARRMMADKGAADSATANVAFFDLSGEITERPASFSIFSAGGGTTLRELISRVEKARDDASIKAALFYVGPGTGLNLSQCGEVRDAIIDFRTGGKKAFVYADTFDTAGYVLATGASDICLMQGGAIFVPGVGFQTMFFKGALDKLGVKADYVQIGEYKGAEEPFNRTEPSDELKGEMNKLVDAYYGQIVEGIAKQRKLSAESVKKVIDNVMLAGPEAKEAGWVDHVVDVDGLRELIKKELGQSIDLAHDYGAPMEDRLDLSNPFALFQMLAKTPTVSTAPKVAVIYVEGTIVDGVGGTSLMGGSSVGSEDLRQSLRLALRDETVKAVILRIDSPGGSALASEAMWQAARRVAEKKPLVISVGSMAASGGYYLASAGEWIVADSSAIVGSIGVVGGKFVMTGLFDKLGISTMEFSRGENANLFSSTDAFDDKQRTLVRNWMKNTYKQFTERVKETRGDKIKDLDKVARGRIFLAGDALALGMVDQIGGLKSAVNYAADRAKLPATGYDVMVLPHPRTLVDMISGRGGAQTAASVDGADGFLPVRPAAVSAPLVEVDSPLRLLPASTRQLLGQQFQLMQILDKRPVALMTPFVVTDR